MRELLLACLHAEPENPNTQPLFDDECLDDEEINVTYDPKPIPDRQFDYVATFNDYEPGQLVGYGATEQEAIDDLEAQVEEDYDCPIHGVVTGPDCPRC